MSVQRAEVEDKPAALAEEVLSTAFSVAKQAAQQLYELYKDYKKKPGLTDEERIAKVVAEVLKQNGQGNATDGLSSDQLKELLKTRIQQEELLKEREQLLAAREEVLGQDADLDPTRQEAQKDLVKDLDKQLEDVDNKLAELDQKQTNLLDGPKEGRKIKAGSIGEALEKEGYFNKPKGPALQQGTKVNFGPK